jgi:CRP-like cAMP-binding protein
LSICVKVRIEYEISHISRRKEVKMQKNNSENPDLGDYMDFSVFGSLSTEAEVYTFEAGEPIIRFDRPIEKLWYMVSGKAKITLVHEDGKQSIVHFVREREYIGELTFLEVEKQHKNVIALCKCQCLAIPMVLAKAHLKRDPDFLFRMNQYIGEKLIKRTWFTAKNQNYELKNRLAAYILISQVKGLYSQKHTETAEYLGVSYRHLLYTLKQLVDEGSLEKIKGGYGVHKEKLEALARDIQLM